MPRELSDDHRRFVDEYLIDRNGTRAYRAVYPGVTYATARNAASKLLAKSNIRAEIRAGQRAIQKLSQTSAVAVIREARRLAFSDPLYLFDQDGSPLPMRDIPLDTRRAVASVKVRRERTERNGDTTTHYDTIEIKLWPKTAGLETLVNHLGLKKEITPLDAFLAALPPDLADQVRSHLLPGGAE